MAVRYGFFNSVDGDRKYSAEDIGRYLQGIITSGVYADNKNNLKVLAGSGMQVEVQPGRGMLEYHYIENDAPLTFTLSAGGTMDRIDAIVMRLDMDRRLCEIAVKEGTPATTPAAPTMLRTDNTKEYMLASVYVTRLTTAITQDKITDTRANTKLCGWVTGLVSQDVLGLPVPNAGDVLKIPQVNAAGDGYELLPTDTTLSFAGAPADAAATAKAIERVDLRGYGLGGNPVPVFAENINDTTLAGWYAVGGCTITGLDVMALRVDGDGGNVVQTGLVWDWANSAHHIIRRARAESGNWEKWAWENPPMVPGVRYKTTERHNGLPVYKVLVELGELPNTNTVMVACPLSDNSAIISVDGYAQSVTSTVCQAIPFISSNGTVACKVHASIAGVYVVTFADVTGYHGYATVKYTSTVDEGHDFDKLDVYG